MDGQPIDYFLVIIGRATIKTDAGDCVLFSSPTTLTGRFLTYLTPNLAATRFHCDRCDKPLSLLTALAMASPFQKKNKRQMMKMQILSFFSVV